MLLGALRVSVVLSRCSFISVHLRSSVVPLFLLLNGDVEFQSLAGELQLKWFNVF